MQHKTALQFPLNKVKEVVHKWLYLEDDDIIDVLMGTILANRINTDPLWLMVIAPPSNAKTELLRGFDGYEHCYFLSSLTPATLVSGLVDTKNKKAEPSLLPMLNDKIIIMKDFTSILSLRSEHKQEILSQLREIYDGSYFKPFGTGKRFEWRGRVGLIAACTPAYDKHYGAISALGERFVLYRTQSENQEKMGLRAQQFLGQEDKMRAEIREAFQSFLKQFNNIECIQLEQNQDINNKIVYLACFCAMGRCAVERDYRQQNIQYIPSPEGPARLTKQFTMLGTGMALAEGKNAIDEEVYRKIKKVAFSILPVDRKRILTGMWDEDVFEHLHYWKKTSEISEAVRIPKSTVKYVLEDLNVIEMVNKELTERNDCSEEDRNLPYKWQISDKAYEYASKAVLFDTSNSVPF